MLSQFNVRPTRHLCDTKTCGGAFEEHRVQKTAADCGQGQYQVDSAKEDNQSKENES